MVASVPLVSTFVRARAAKGCERRNRDTRALDRRCSPYANSRTREWSLPMTKRFIELAGMRDAYKATLTPIIPEYSPISIAHGVVTEGGKTLRMSGWPAIGPQGIIGKGDMRVQTLQAMDYVRQTVEAAGATWDDIVYLLFYFVDREKWWREALP